jgi:hypothetical protein
MLSCSKDDSKQQNTIQNPMPDPFTAPQLPFNAPQILQNAPFTIQNPLPDPFAAPQMQYIDPLTFSPPAPPVQQTFAMPAAPVALIKPVKFQLAIWPEFWKFVRTC